MKFGTCYSGIGGADAGMCAAGWEAVFQAEKDPYRQKVLAKRWPDVPRFYDVRHVISEDTPRADVIYAEFPDANLERWWEPMCDIMHFERPDWLIIECSPSASPSKIIRDMALAGWWFRLVKTGIRIATSSLQFEDQHTRQRLHIFASHDRGLIDGLKLDGYSADMTVDVGDIPFERGTFDHFECAMGFKTGWSCVCGLNPCACDPEARLLALREATPPHMTLWLAHMVDGRWSSDQQFI